MPEIDISQVDTLFADGGGRIAGVGLTRPDGAAETIGCKAVILACNGYGGNPELVAENIPEIAGALSACSSARWPPP